MGFGLTRWAPGERERTRPPANRLRPQAAARGTWASDGLQSTLAHSRTCGCSKAS